MAHKTLEALGLELNHEYRSRSPTLTVPGAGETGQRAYQAHFRPWEEMRKPTQPGGTHTSHRGPPSESELIYFSSHQCYNNMTLGRTILFEDLLCLLPVDKVPSVLCSF